MEYRIGRKDVHDISIGDIDGDSCLELAVGTLIIVNYGY